MVRLMCNASLETDPVPAIVALLDENDRRFLERWHWFNYHAQQRTPFMVSVALACTRLARISADAPRRMLRELAAIGGRDRNRDDYNQLIQKLSEILVMQEICGIAWPDQTSVEIESSAPGSPRQVDCVVRLLDGHVFGFEVKAPAYLDHRDLRGQGGMQFPVRGPSGSLDLVRRADENVILPRDNTIRDFLRSANQKFAAFKAAGAFTGILVIVWDDFIYEAISPLVHERMGLLTSNSYSRDGEGPELYSNVDAVILLRHLTYFEVAAAEGALPDQREHGMHLGGEGALPNVVVPIPGGRQVPDFITAAFNAVSYDDEVLSTVADYRANDLVMWQRV
jgi:hypothetical protein